MKDLSRYRKHSGWKKYRSSKSRFGISEYAIGTDFILIIFQNSNEVYVYDYEHTGRENVTEMNRLAVKGEGLSGFISKNVHDRYAASLSRDFFR